MTAKKLAAVLLGLAVATVAGAVSARTDEPSNEQQPSLIDRLDNFGKKVFNTILPPSKSKSKTLAKSDLGAVNDPSKFSDSQANGQRSARAGSVLAGRASRPAEVDPSSGVLDQMPEEAPPTDTRNWEDARSQSRRQVPEPSLPNEEPRSRAARPSQETPADAAKVPSQWDSLGDGSAAAELSKPAKRPLDERMAAFRRSAVAASGDQPPQSQTDPQSERPSAASEIAEPKEFGLAGDDSRKQAIVAQRVAPEPRAGDIVGGVPPLEGASPSLNAPSRTEAAKPADTPKPDNQDGVLVTRKSPILSVDTIGPRTISVGRESSYEVSISNSGEVPADGLIVFISLPEWAEVASAGASTGTAEMAKAGQASGTIDWKVGTLNTKGRERLTLRIIPRQSRSFDLAVHWAYKPPASQAVIEVQEPKLLLQLDGPREVLYGKKQLFHLKLTNTGSGNADNVVLTLLPLGTGANVPASHQAGLLKAGEEKTLDVELTARQSGNLTIQVDARAEGGVRAQLSEKVLVRRASLKATIEGPKMQFVGTAGTYTVTLRNPGNAAARKVNVSVALPAGARYLSGVDGARLNVAGGRVEWTVDTLAPEVEQTFALKCTMGLAGAGQLRLEATADDDLASSAEMTVQIQSVASLTMEVRDPAGPTAIGEEAVYEIHVRNRGTRDAQGIEVFGYFSRGIEPTGADGAPSRLGPGQVVFQAIPTLAAGAETVFKVRAKADVAGNHVFRAEAHCKVLGSHLIREATNLYYGDAPAAQEASRRTEQRGQAK